MKEPFKILKYVLGAFMLRRTKSTLMESGTLLLPPVTEITVLVSLKINCIFYMHCVSFFKKLVVSFLLHM